MDPGERTDTIGALVSCLVSKDALNVETLLEQFGVLENWRSYSHDRAHLSRYLGDVNNDTLVALRDYCARSQSVPTVESLELPKCWSSDDLKLFISHASTDKELAHELQRSLELLGSKAFVAHTDIEPDEPWQQEIERALCTADVLVCICTDDSKQSAWVNQEIGWSLCRQIPVYSVRDGADPFGFSANVQAISSARSDSSNTAQKLLELLSKRDIYRNRVLDSLTQALQDSRSFKQSTAIAKVLECLVPWPVSIEEAITEATDSNRQVRESYVAKGIFKTHLSNREHVDNEEIPF